MNESDRLLAAALGRIPSGLFVLTLRRETIETGMLVSWVQQCSFDPPQLTLAIKPGRAIAELLSNDSAFGLNVLEDSQNRLVSHFAKGFEIGESAFQGLEVVHTPEGVPVLPAALAHLTCRVVSRVAAGDHDLVIGRIIAGRVHDAGRPYVHIRKSGLNY